MRSRAGDDQIGPKTFDTDWRRELFVQQIERRLGEQQQWVAVSQAHPPLRLIEGRFNASGDRAGQVDEPAGSTEQRTEPFAVSLVRVWERELIAPDPDRDPLALARPV